MTSREVQNLLGELCVKLGFCLPGPAIRRISTCPPPTVDRFTDVVIRAEGLNPREPHMRRMVRKIVADHFANSGNADSVG